MYVPHFLEQRTRAPSSQFADYAPATPLVPFGWGLSYSNFSFAEVKLTADVPGCAGGANCTVTAGCYPIVAPVKGGELKTNGTFGLSVSKLYF
jgi:hypothetical protein